MSTERPTDTAPELGNVTPTPPRVWVRIEDFRGNPEGDPLVWWWNEDGSEKMATDEALLDGDGLIIGKSMCGMGYYTHVMLAEFPEPPDVSNDRPTETAEPRGCPTPGVCSALAEIRILRSQVEALHAAVRTAYEDGFEEAACRGGSTVDDDLASAAVDGILNKAIDAAMRSVAAGTP